ncbi:MAG: hypothetical protein WA783_16985 [Phormidesmis sp.]
MTFKSPSAPSSASQYVSPQNHRKPLVVRGLQWFWRFSQFYGEYTVRSPQARQQWVNEQQKQRG